MRGAVAALDRQGLTWSKLGVRLQKGIERDERTGLALTEDADAASAGLAVGYESPTQFNREYKRMFGEPPRRDVMRRR